MRFNADIQHLVVLGNSHTDHHQFQRHPLSEKVETHQRQVTPSMTLKQFISSSPMEDLCEQGRGNEMWLQSYPLFIFFTVPKRPLHSLLTPFPLKLMATD